MKTRIRIDANDSTSIDAAIQTLQEKNAEWDEKLTIVCERLATLGATRCSLEYSRANYDGVNDISVSVEKTERGYRVIANGQSLLFIEFGSGARYGYGHPKAQEFGYGPGTYPGKGHWDDPNGWYYGHGQKSYGNAPTEGMYLATVDIENNIARIVKEVFDGS